MMKPKKELELLVRFQYKCLARLVSCYANIISYYYFFVILIGLNILSSLKQNLGDLDKVKRIVKLVGFVQCVDGYKNQPFVINGCSDLMFEVFGDKVGLGLGLGLRLDIHISLYLISFQSLFMWFIKQ